MKFEIYCDGGCRGNQFAVNVGAWAYQIISASGSKKEKIGVDYCTTNNKMELMACISALEALTQPSEVKLYTDSQYVVFGITEWIRGWKRHGWRTAGKKPVTNKDLWEKLDSLNQKHKVQWIHVKGHSDCEGNLRVDYLLNEAMDAVTESKA